ncbi:MAG: hypothetical protein D6696_17445 [Acidobacteria bacterium]|nr:MAG: hypothetical protein D6696_17445 [Acidobacteriota bacterium]
MNKLCRPLTLLVATLLAWTPPAMARTEVKMATLAPDGSVWDKALKEMGGDWQRATGGDVVLRIYAGGIAGDEPDVVRKMRIGQLHAAALTTAGLSALDNAFEVFQLPMFFASYDELFHVLEVLRPELEKRLFERGYVLLNWGHGGWVHLFSKRPVRTVEDLRGMKLFTWSGDDTMFQIWRKEGFQPVALATTDVMVALQTGMIDALPTTPLAALSLQWYRHTPYMQDLGVAPLIGATVISRRLWDKLAPETRSKLRAAALEVERKLEVQVPDQDRRAIEQMKQRGLEVTVVGDDQLPAWRAFAERFAAQQRQLIEAHDMLDRLRQVRDAYRAGGGR